MPPKTQNSICGGFSLVALSRLLHSTPWLSFLLNYVSIPFCTIYWLVYLFIICPPQPTTCELHVGRVSLLLVHRVPPELKIAGVRECVLSGRTEK